jgi:membrane fusion protein (multidrug efflux system)
MAGQDTTTGSSSAKALKRCGELFFLSLLALLSLNLAGCHKKKPAPPPPPEVQVITVTPTNLPIYGEWIGSLSGSVNAQIRAQVTGYLQTQDYSEGGVVKKGDLLFQIDRRPFQAALDEAKARLAQDEALVEKTRLDVERFTPLAKTQSISQQDLDNAVQAHAGARASVQADQAAVETAALNLGFTRITSPIDGVAGVAQAQIGDLVGPGTGLLTAVSTIDPIKVFFQVSEQSYMIFWKRFALTENTNQPDLQLELILTDGSTYPEKGKFLFADREVNVNTGTLPIAGLFPNEKLLLRPGQFARVRAQVQTKTNALLVPQRAVTELQGSFQIAVVGESNKVNLATVSLGDQVGRSWIVEKGLNPGDRVVVEGLQKARAGTVVNPKPWEENVAALQR